MGTLFKYGLIAAFSAFIAGASIAPAQAGSWGVDLGLCPDYMEDLLDREEDLIDLEEDLGWTDRLEDRLDRRENRRDERRTYCPKTSLFFDRDGPGDAKVYDKPDGIVLRTDGYDFYRVGRKGRRIYVLALEPTFLDIERYRTQRRIERAQERAGLRRTYRGDPAKEDVGRDVLKQDDAQRAREHKRDYENRRRWRGWDEEHGEGWH